MPDRVCRENCVMLELLGAGTPSSRGYGAAEEPWIAWRAVLKCQTVTAGAGYAHVVRASTLESSVTALDRKAAFCGRQNQCCCGWRCCCMVLQRYVTHSVYDETLERMG